MSPCFRRNSLRTTTAFLSISCSGLARALPSTRAVFRFFKFTKPAGQTKKPLSRAENDPCNAANGFPRSSAQGQNYRDSAPAA